MRLIVIAIASVALFFPAYIFLSGPFGNDWGAGLAMVLMFLVFPAIVLTLWKSRQVFAAHRSSFAEEIGYWFKSTLFEIEPGEDEETNPRVYGKQPAMWLKSKFEALGYDVEEAFPEDWGWCVMCAREPYWLWIGCTNLRDYDTAKPGDPPPKKEDVFWLCFPVAEVPFFKRLFKKVDTSRGFAALDRQLREILTAEPSIKLVDAP